MKKRIFTTLFVFAMMFSMMMGTITSMAANETNMGVDLALLDTESHPNARSDVETRQERHERLTAEGYVLEDIQIVNKGRSLSMYGPDGKIYQTRVVRSTYTQPTQTTVQYGEQYLNILTNNTVGTLVETAVGFVPKVGWMPSVFGIDVNSLADFLSRGRITYVCDSTLFFYDIEVRLAGTDKYYFVASSEKIEVVMTAVSSGFNNLGSPVQKTSMGNAISKSQNYENENALSVIAVEYYVTGGPSNTYIYTEKYPDYEVELKEVSN